MLIALAGVLAAGGAGMIAVGVAQARQDDALEGADEYLQSLEWTREEADEFAQLLEEPFLTRVLRPMASRLLGTASEVLPRNYRDRIHQQLIYAGLTTQYRAEEIVTAQILAGIVGLVVAIFLVVGGVLTANLAIVALVLLPFAGQQLPRSVIERKAQERQTAIQRDLPDTLDLLAISVEAGVGFEGALEVVSDNFDSPLASEFSRTLREMELGLPRKLALENLRRRTDVPDLSNFILTLTQADALGMPIGRILKTQSGEMRLKRRARAREAAAKLPVKILFPLMPIMLATFIIVLGPAASSIGGAF